ncbi:MAG: DUF6785 family protein [Elusimicrobiota bacterium]
MTFRSIILALVFVVISALWVWKFELMLLSCNLTEAIPPIPALAGLIFLVVLYPLLKYLGVKNLLTRGEIMVVFIFNVIATLMFSIGVFQAFLPYTSVLYYHDTVLNKYADFRQYVPSWFGPRDPEVIRGFWEGTPDGAVPWAHWIKPLAVYLGFFLLYWWIATCVWTVMRKQWAENERLTFPLLSIPLSLSEEAAGEKLHAKDEKPFLSNPLMWLGFSIAGISQVFNLLNTIDPSFPALGNYFRFSTIFTEQPLKSISGVILAHRPEVVGLGYLVPSEILFSTWICYWIEQLVVVAGAVVKTNVRGFPLINEQGIGAYMAMVVIVLYVARKHLYIVFKKAFTSAPEIDDKTEPLPYRVAVFGGLLGFMVLIGFCMISGMSPWLAIFFFGVLLSFVMVYGRIRAETGIPSVWTLPISQIKSATYHIWGTDTLTSLGGSLSSLAILSSFGFMMNGGFFNQSTVYQLESFQLGDKTGVSRRHIVWLGLGAVFTGFILGAIMYLSTYYQYGLNNLTTGTRTTYSLQIWNEVTTAVSTPPIAYFAQKVAYAAGFVITGIMFVIRQFVWTKMPLNPIGYLIATNGAATHVWWPFFVAWVCKGIIFRVGGVKLYKTLIPTFLGLVIGQFFFAGIFWGFIHLFFPQLKFHIWFT